MEAWSLAPTWSMGHEVALEVMNFRRRAKPENTFACLIKREVLLSVRTAIWEKANTRLQTVLQKSRKFVRKNLHDVGIQ